MAGENDAPAPELPAGDGLLVVLYYKYRAVPDVEAEASAHRELCASLGLSGRVLLSGEGVNGTLCGPDEAVLAYQAYMEGSEVFRMRPTDWKHSRSDADPFPDMAVKVVREIVSTGGVIPMPTEEDTDTHLPPQQFHEQLSESYDPETGKLRDDVVLLDVRCHKEFLIGRFEDATDAKTQTFADYVRWMGQEAPQMRDKKVLMYCTGGIRCEKASRFLIQNGCNEVYQLKGGIHKYLDAYPDGGYFRGKNFIFDKRVALGSTNEEVVGRCYRCDVPWEEMRGDVVCTVCRDLVLACDACKEALRGEFHCEMHEFISDCYFTNLAPFSVDELREQVRLLREKAAPFAQGQRFKNRRRTFRRQIAKVEARIAQLESGEAPPEVPLCRTCGSPAAECAQGTCWGFWRREDVPAVPEHLQAAAAAAAAAAGPEAGGEAAPPAVPVSA